MKGTNTLLYTSDEYNIDKLHCFRHLFTLELASKYNSVLKLLFMTDL